MRALKINPYLRRVEEVEIDTYQLEAEEGGTIEPVYGAIKKIVFDNIPIKTSGYIEHVSLGGVMHGWIDEEGLLSEWDMQAFFAFGNYKEHQWTFAGNMLVTQEDWKGNTVPVTCSTTAIAALITWLHPKEVRVPAPRITSYDSNGRATVTLVGGKEEWDYKNQPT
jgi:hypothetical protein